MNCIRSGEGCKEADPLDKSLITEHGMQMRLCRCDMGVVTLEGQEVNLNGNRGVTAWE